MNRKGWGVLHKIFLKVKKVVLFKLLITDNISIRSTRLNSKIGTLFCGEKMAMSTIVLENLTLRDIPPVWVKKFSSQPGQYFTVRITSMDVPTPITKISMRKARIALMREMERQLGGNGYEDSEEWIKTIKETRTFSKPKSIF